MQTRDFGNIQLSHSQLLPGDGFESPHQYGRWFSTHKPAYVRLISDGNGPQVGRYFGLDLADEGEPAYFADNGATIRFSLDYYSEQARLAFLDWCETGELPTTPMNGLAVWAHVIFQGNLQVHNSPRDGD